MSTDTTEGPSRGLSYTDSELTLEQLMSTLGAERYRADVTKSLEDGTETHTGPGRLLMRRACVAMSDALEEWQAAELNKTGPLGHAAEELVEYDTGIVATLTCKVLLDSVSHKRSVAACAKAIASALEDDARFSQFQRDVPKLWTALKKGFKHNISHSSKRRKIVDVMRRLNMTWETWKPSKKIRIGMVLLDLFLTATDIFTTMKVHERGGKKTHLFLMPTAETLKWMEESHAFHEALSPVYLPMRDLPAPWTNLHDGGYLTNLVRRTTLVKTRDRTQLEEAEQGDMSEVLSCANALQATAWEVNSDVFQVASHLWETSGSSSALPKRDDLELPEKPGDIATNEDARVTWRRRAALVYDRNVSGRSRRMQATRIIHMARQFEHGPFYFPYTCDFRGRFYPTPQFLQPQGPSLARGLLRFAYGKPVGSPEAAVLFAAHGANMWGFDKCSMAARAAWAWEHLPQISKVAEDPLAYRWWEEADSPWEFLAWCLEFAQFALEGLTFVSRIPVAMDGSNNGLQIFSLLLRDRAGGTSTNCTASEVPQDIYQEVADEVTKGLHLAEINLSDDTAQKKAWASQWLGLFNGAVPRAAVKRSVMTLPYGSTKYSCQRYVLEWVDDEFGENPFGKNNYKASWFLVELIWKAIGKIVIAARAAMGWLQACAKLASKEDKPLIWTAPSGFPVRQAYRRQKWTTVETHIGDRVRWTKILTEDARGKVYDSKRQTNGISPNIVHSLDAAALVKTVNSCAYQGIFSFAMIHDSFGTLAADAPLMGQVLRNEYASMFSKDILGDLRDQFQNLVEAELPPLPTYGDLDPKEVLGAKYFFA